MLTDNPVMLRGHHPLPALMCLQRKAEKKIVTDEDSLNSNIASFGDDIGKTTNWITSMFEVQSHYEPGSKEYETLAYRICAGEQAQQNAMNCSWPYVAIRMTNTVNL